MSSGMAASPTVLSDDLGQGCGERATMYDRENRPDTEDPIPKTLMRSVPPATLSVLVPRDLGGRGLSVAEVCKKQERLAYRALAFKRRLRLALARIW